MDRLPTIAASGLPGYESVNILGVLAPAKTPPAVLRKLNTEIARIVALPEVKQEWAAQGATAMTQSVEEFERCHCVPAFRCWVRYRSMALLWAARRSPGDMPPRIP